MKTTIITKKNLTTKLVRKGLKNPKGMNFENTPEIRKAVKTEIDNILNNLQSKRGN